MTEQPIDVWLGRAVAGAAASPNGIRKVGALLVTADGTEIAACNDFPPGILALPERTVGDNRFIWLEHAERSALFDAAKRGHATFGATLVSNYFPCTDCARAVVMAGVKTVATPRPEFDDPVWGESFRTSATLLAEGAVEIVYLAENQERIHRRIWTVETNDIPKAATAGSGGVTTQNG